MKETGRKCYLAEPGTWGWLTPYLASVAGLAGDFLVRPPEPARSRHRRRTARLPIEVFDRYHDRIEKDLEKLE